MFLSWLHLSSSQSDLLAAFLDYLSTYRIFAVLILDRFNKLAYNVGRWVKLNWGTTGKVSFLFTSSAIDSNSCKGFLKTKFIFRRSLAIRSTLKWFIFLLDQWNGVKLDKSNNPFFCSFSFWIESTGFGAGRFFPVSRICAGQIALVKTKSPRQ